MQVARPRGAMTVAVERGRSAIELAGGVDIVLHDVEIRSGMQAGVFERVERLPAAPSPFSARRTPSGPVIVPFIGGLGDAVAMLPVLEAIRRQARGFPLSVCTTTGPAEVFRLSRAVDHVIAYPATLEQWCGFDSYGSMECVEASGAAPGRNLSRTFAAALGIDIDGCGFRWELPRGGPRPERPSVGIAMGPRGRPRSIPARLVSELIDELVTRRIGCVLLGDAEDGEPVTRVSPLVMDLRGRTKRIAELAAWVGAMQAMVVHDSFVMHLAGSLGTPSVALCVPTSAGHATGYRGMTAIVSRASCSPCHGAGVGCPRGWERCRAWDELDAAPSEIARRLVEMIEARSRSAA
jgi:hypothetical protein